MRAVELFAGVGGFRLGLERAGHQVVWSNEWDKFACDTYDFNFNGSIDRRDITTVAADAIPDHDVLVGGFPCQAFSVAGKRRGFEDTRGTLFFDIARIVEFHRPAYLFLENVKGLLSHDRGNTFETILRTLDELGYDCQWQVLNSKDFGVPQNRERVFIVGHFRGRPRPQVFPLIGAGQPDSQEAGWQGEGHKPARALRSHQGGIDLDDQLVAVQGINHPSRGIEPRKDGLAATLKAGESGTQKPKALIADRIRRLTPVECERLQGFPDNWTQYGLKNGQPYLMSDTQRYKQMGNAVTVNVIEAIAQRLVI